MDLKTNDADFNKMLELVKKVLTKKRDIEKRVMNIKRQIEERWSDIATIQTTVSDLRLSIYKLAKDVEVLKNRIDMIENNMDELPFHDLPNRSELDRCFNGLKSVESDVEALKKLKNKVEDVYSSLSFIKILRSDVVKFQNTLTKYTNSIDLLEKKIEWIEKKLLETESRTGEILERVGKLVDEKDIDKLRDEIKELRNMVAEIKMSEEIFEGKVNEQVADMLGVIAKMRKEGVRIDDLRGMEKRISNISQTVNKIDSISNQLNTINSILKTKVDKNELKLLKKRVEKYSSLYDIMIKRMKLFAEGKRGDDIRKLEKTMEEKINNILKTIEQNTVSLTDFLILKERVFEIEESLKNLEMIYISKERGS